jgi:hypothetical protein
MISFTRHHDDSEFVDVPAPMRYALRGAGIPLVIGRYSVKVASPEVTLPGWEKPTYEGVSEQFDITHGGSTTVDVTCKMTNLKVTVAFAEGLWSILDRDNVNVEVTVNGQSLDFVNGDPAGGYFAVPAEGCEMTVTLTGEIPETLADAHWEGTVIETIPNVKPGEWRQVSFYIPDDTDFPVMLLDGSTVGQIGEGQAW